MHGAYEAKVFDAKGLGDGPFLRAVREGKLDHLLVGLPVKQQATGHNLVLDNWMPSISFDTFGAVEIDSDFVATGSNTTRGPLGMVVLVSTSTEPTYTEYGGCDYTVGDTYRSWPPNRVDSTYSSKRFIEDRAESATVVETEPGREAVRLVERFLWLPSQGNLSNIRSLEVWWMKDQDEGLGTTYVRMAKVCRARLKDGGVPVTLSKTTDEALLIQYTFTLVGV
jgi:hypothetical protein